MAEDDNDDGKNQTQNPGNRSESLQITLEEARLRYQEEAERRNSVESKIGTILTVDAIIVSIVGLFENLTWLPVLAMAAALASVFLGIYGLRAQDYIRPGKDVDDYLQYINQSPGVLKKELAKSYMTSVSGNEEADNPEKYKKGNRTRNDEKFQLLRISQFLTAVSLLLVLSHSVLSQSGINVRRILEQVL